VAEFTLGDLEREIEIPTRKGAAFERSRPDPSSAGNSPA
jgi:hypothetical protein